jgi:hypothetical protein
MATSQWSRTVSVLSLLDVSADILSPHVFVGLQQWLPDFRFYSLLKVILVNRGNLVSGDYCIECSNILNTGMMDAAELNQVIVGVLIKP